MAAKFLAHFLCNSHPGFRGDRQTGPLTIELVLPPYPYCFRVLHEPTCPILKIRSTSDRQDLEVTPPKKVCGGNISTCYWVCQRGWSRVVGCWKRPTWTRRSLDRSGEILIFSQAEGVDEVGCAAAKFAAKFCCENFVFVLLIVHPQ